MPPSGFNTNVVQGALIFVRGCYLDLLDEVKSGKHGSYEEAIEYELRQISSALEQLHIDKSGRLTRKVAASLPRRAKTKARETD
jgi:hypothetical protein